MVGAAAGSTGGGVTAAGSGLDAAVSLEAIALSGAVGDAVGVAPTVGEPVGDGLGEATVVRVEALDPASTPVMVGAAEVFATGVADGSWPAVDREVRLARNHTMPISTATASTTIDTRRIQ